VVNIVIGFDGSDDYLLRGENIYNFIESKYFGDFCLELVLTKNIHQCHMIPAFVSFRIVTIIFYSERNKFIEIGIVIFN